MTDHTPNSEPAEADDAARDRREDEELAPEEKLLEGWLPEAEPTEGTAPAP
jgi:hypothetical protein